MEKNAGVELTGEERTLLDAQHTIRFAHATGTLARFIGDALGKNAVMVVLIDTVGAIVTEADNRANTPNSKRDRSMILQMTELLAKNMEEMMKKAGKDAKET